MRYAKEQDGKLILAMFLPISYNSMVRTWRASDPKIVQYALLRFFEEGVKNGDSGALPFTESHKLSEYSSEIAGQKYYAASLTLNLTLEEYEHLRSSREAGDTFPEFEKVEG